MEAKAGLIDPSVSSGRAAAYQIKVTPGITGLFSLRVQIHMKLWHLDVAFWRPGTEKFSKGLAVRQLKPFVR